MRKKLKILSKANNSITTTLEYNKNYFGIPKYNFLSIIQVSYDLHTTKPRQM